MFSNCNNVAISLRQVAESRGMSEMTLINWWIQEKLNQTNINKKSEQSA